MTIGSAYHLPEEKTMLIRGRNRLPVYLKLWSVIR
jgi:hypothetical protein